MEKKVSVKVEQGKFVINASVAEKIDGDKDGQPFLEFESNNNFKLDVVEGLSELSKTSDKELLKKIAPFIETLHGLVQNVNATIIE